MHIPDAYLSPATQAGMFCAMTPLWFVAARETRRSLAAKQAPLLSIGAAFCFAIQMFNIPALGGTTAHPLGAALLAILVGPWAAMLGLTLSLTIQALLFGDGGILSLGANSFDMAFVAPFVAFGLYKLLSGRSSPGSARQIAAAGIGAYAGIVTASLCAGILLGIQPGIAHDAAGHALYCPFGLGVSVPSMVMSHLLVAGPAEAIVTVSALAYIWRSFPELVSVRSRPKVGQGLRLARVLVWFMLLTPIGLLAGGDAFGEWDLDTLRKMIGYAPSGVAHAHEWVKPVLPDYGFAGLEGGTWQVIGYMVSALVGCALVAAFTRWIVSRPKAPMQIDVSVRPPTSNLPAWLLTPNPAVPSNGGRPSLWLQRTILRMRESIARTLASEQIARQRGMLQAVNPFAKTLGFLGALLATGLARAPLPLAIMLAGVVLAASCSRVPLKSFLVRVLSSVAFFGLVFAIPMSLRAVTPGPTAFTVLGVAVSTSGLNAAALILLRLATGISLAMLWQTTTRWSELLRSLRRVGVPPMFLTSAALTYRYIFVMVETAAEMVEARTARQVGACDKRQARVYAGSGTAILFAKSVAFTEELHWAMLSRTCDGPSSSRERPRWTAYDVATASVGISALLIIVLQRTIHAA